jgi:hypothetical protein
MLGRIRVRQAFAAMICGIIILSNALVPASSARAETLYPVWVTVSGQGAIRFRMTAGTTAPDDSAASGKIFDNWLAPGEYTLMTPSVSICYQHTHGAFREINWTTARCLSAIEGRRRLARPAHIVITTD